MNLTGSARFGINTNLQFSAFAGIFNIEIPEYTEEKSARNSCKNLNYRSIESFVSRVRE